MRILGILTALLAMGLSLPATAQVTNFSRDVAASIDSGLAWLDANGAFANPSACGNGAGLCALALLEKRESADQNADFVGYANASPADQARIDRVIAYILSLVNAQYYTYREGASLMALSVYLRSGGPRAAEARGAINTLFDRLAANQNGNGYWCYNDGGCDDSSTTQLAMAGLAAARGVFNDPAFADAARLARLNQVTANCGAAYRNFAQNGNLGNGEKGHGYRRGREPSYQQTASGLWGQIIGGSDLNEATVQSYLRWQYQHYNYRTIGGANNGWNRTYFYYMWSSAKAYTFLEDSGIVPNAGNLSPDDVGTLAPGAAPAYNARLMHLDPTTIARVPSRGNDGAGYYNDQFELARWYFDYAHTLMSTQLADGRYNANSLDGQTVWNNFSGQSYVLLVLLRSVGGGCLDTDGDGICDGDDICPADPDPAQPDSDGDGAGDACDNCPGLANIGQDNVDGDAFGDACDNCVNVANDDQADQDNDGFGNVCDNCAEVANPDQRDGDDDGVGDFCDDCVGDPREEICDDLDNDCDGEIDEDLGGGACNTDLPGVCAEGVEICRDGLVECVPSVEPSPEVCDGLDNDCNGVVDDNIEGDGGICATGLPGACAEGTQVCAGGDVICTPLNEAMEEACEGTDEDCDGMIDENLRNACGLCGDLGPDICDGIDNDCDGLIDEDAMCPGREACINGTCVDPCDNNECPGGEVCISGYCVDPCSVLDCAEGEICTDGVCIDPCVDVECGDLVCHEGECVPNSCNVTGCPEDEHCINDVCRPNPCANVECNDGEFCREGICVSSCAAVSCPLNETCADGECVADDCSMMSCDEGQICQDGECFNDPCGGIDCAGGQVCIDGLCQGSPCDNVDCPPGERCELNAIGQAQCVGDWIEGAGGAGGDPGAGGAGGDPGAGGAGGDPGAGGAGGDPGAGGAGGTPFIDGGISGQGGMMGGDDDDSGGAGGCNCGVANDQGSPWFFLMLGLFPIMRRRRR